MKVVALIAAIGLVTIGLLTAFAADVSVDEADIDNFTETDISVVTPTTIECKNLGHVHTDPNANPGHTHEPGGGGNGHVHCPDQLPEMGVVLDPEDPTLIGLVDESGEPVIEGTLSTETTTATTSAPTSAAAPTTVAPTTAAPTTVAPTTVAPTTAAPTTAPSSPTT